MIFYLLFTENAFKYKLGLSGGPVDKGIIISIDQEYIVLEDTTGEVGAYLEYDENTIVFNKKWRRTNIDLLKVGDYIEVYASGYLVPEQPMTFYGEVILILEKE